MSRTAEMEEYRVRRLASLKDSHPGAKVSIAIYDEGAYGFRVEEEIDYGPGMLSRWLNKLRGRREQRRDKCNG